MPRAPDERVNKAKELFDQGFKLTDIAKKLNVLEGTVRSWKSRYKWDCNVANDKCNVANKNKQNKKDIEIVAEEVSQVMENPDLTDKQRLFCCLYARCFNATKAYQKAYRCSYETAMVEGCKCLRKPKIRSMITELKQNRLNQEMLDETDIFQKYMDIAFADITDFLEFGTKEVQVMSMHGPVEVKDPETGKKVPLMKTVNAVQFRDSSQVDGTLISEVKQGRDGASIKLSDRMRALQWLSDHMDLATDEQKTKIKLMEMQITAAASTGNEAVEDWIDAVTEEDSEAISDDE